MKRGAAGFLGGVLGGLIMLVINFGETGANSVSSWIIYILITGFIGWIMSKILSKKFIINPVYSGTITGVVLWLLMNIVFMFSGRIIPPWSMGLSTLILSLFSYIILGVVITYTISKSQLKVTK